MSLSIIKRESNPLHVQRAGVKERDRKKEYDVERKGVPLKTDTNVSQTQPP